MVCVDFWLASWQNCVGVNDGRGVNAQATLVVGGARDGIYNINIAAYHGAMTSIN